MDLDLIELIDFTDIVDLTNVIDSISLIDSLFYIRHVIAQNPCDTDGNALKRPAHALSQRQTEYPNRRTQIQVGQSKAD